MNLDELSDQDPELAAKFRTAGITDHIWPVLISNERHLLGVTITGVAVTGPTVEESMSWDQISNGDFGTFSVSLTTRSDDDGPAAERTMNFAFLSRWDADDARSAFQAVRPKPIGAATAEPGGSQRAPLAGADLPQSARSQAGTPARTVTSTVTSTAGVANVRDDPNAKSRLTSLFVFGVLGQIVGGFVIGASWPDTKTSYDAFLEQSNTETSGSVAGVVIGSLLAWAAIVAMMVALIGWGVMLGRRASRSAG